MTREELIKRVEEGTDLFIQEYGECLRMLKEYDKNNSNPIELNNR